MCCSMVMSLPPPMFAGRVPRSEQNTAGFLPRKPGTRTTSRNGLRRATGVTRGLGWRGAPISGSHNTSTRPRRRRILPVFFPRLPGSTNTIWCIRVGSFPTGEFTAGAGMWSRPTAAPRFPRTGAGSSMRTVTGRRRRPRTSSSLIPVSPRPGETPVDRWFR